MREEEMIVVLVFVLGGFAVPLVWIIAHYCYLACKHWQATRLVRDLVARGYTAQEIIQICGVLGNRKVPDLQSITDVPPAKPVRQPAY